MQSGNENIRLTLYRGTDTHLDVRVARGARFAEIRLWRGRRWPDLERVWHARLRRWIPWFSLERQVRRALAYLVRHSAGSLTQSEMKSVVTPVLAELRRRIE